ncbi:MAG: hypothetical protein KME07_15180 [Pegethrix bostrychoides GSE-TBD4-15B]|jgi:hypothetical protein|uniref:Uncharacterized protein n=1 Tax=Pegethrix bostrychoides GSE-TBD4-15B TaxID=2839662 RepID=A0A951PE64_9CYAN|nr:hypothetical protein [Pegethrix bostrychoides GSE-TBD4-15B]
MQRFLREVTLPYSIYLMFFLGVGLLAGSIVHFPQSPLRYFLIGTSGAMIFTVGAILTETVIHRRSLDRGEALRFVLCTLMLSIGIGMISGAIQHFTDIPRYASALIPIGFVLSLISYMLKEKIPFSRKNSSLLGVKIAAIGLPLWLVLNAAAMQIPASGHSHADSHAGIGHHEAQSQRSTDQGEQRSDVPSKSQSPAATKTDSHLGLDLEPTGLAKANRVSFTQIMLAAPAQLDLNSPALLKLQVHDQTGQPVENFDTFQEKLMHLIVVSNDLQSFQHIHPTYQTAGSFAVEAQFSQPGGHTLFADYRPTGQTEQVTVSALAVPGAVPTAASSDLVRRKTVGDIIAQLEAPTLTAGESVTLSFKLSHDDAPLTDLQPYLGEQGHLVIVRQTALLTQADYIHAHALRHPAAESISFETSFPQPGLYKLWGQFNHAGEIVVADFWVQVT